MPAEVKHRNSILLARYYSHFYPDESWEDARKNKNTPLHLIKPMALELDVGKCFYNDDAILPA